MKIRNESKVKYVLLFFFLFIILMNNKCNALAGGFEAFNNAPRMKIYTNSNKYDDVRIRFVDYSGLDETKIVFSDVKNGKKGSVITDKNFIKKIEPIYNEEKTKIVTYEYTISKNYLSTKNPNEFHVLVKDKNNSDCYFDSYFIIVPRKNHFVVNFAPRVFGWKNNNKIVSFVVRDLGGTNSVKIYDMNGSSPSKEVIEKSNLAKGNATVSINLNSFIEKNGIYKIKIIARDNSKLNKQKAIRIVCFKIDKTKTAPPEKTPDMSGKLELDRNLILLDLKHYYFADLTTNAPQGSKINWESSNSDVVKVNNKGRIYGLKNGYSIITASLTNSDGTISKAICKVRVMASAKEYVKGDYKTTSINNTSNKNPLYTNKKISFSNKEIESYINNAAMILKKYPDKFTEGAAQDLRCWNQKNNSIGYNTRNPGNSNFKKVDISRKSGEIDTNGWLILFTSKNQHLYVLKKQKDGDWKVYDEAKSSAGYDCGGKYNYYIAIRYVSKNIGHEVFAFKHWETWRNAPYIHSNTIHPSTAGIANSRPTSNGCIHGGSPNSHILKSIKKAGVGTKLIIY